MDDRNRPVKADDLVDVVVQAEEIDRGRDAFKIAFAHDSVVLEARKVGNHVRRVTALKERFEKQPVRFTIDRSRGLHIVGCIRKRFDDLQAMRDAHLRIAGVGTDGRNREPVGQVQVVGGDTGSVVVPHARCVQAPGMAEKRAGPGFICRDPERHPVAEVFHDRPGMVGEPVRGVPIQPTATFLQVLGKIPVVERDHRRESVLEERVQDTVVMIEAGLVAPRRALGEMRDQLKDMRKLVNPRSRARA